MDRHERANPCKFSIIIPVLHEVEHINALLEHLSHQESEERYEVIVVDGGLNRETINAINYDGTISIGSEEGRARQMNAGAKIAQGEILIFLHADTQLPQGALRLISSALKQNQYVGGSFDLGIDSERFALKGVAYFANLRSRLTCIPYGDQAIFVRKDYFREIGGYREIPFMEDVELMRRIKKRGDKICILSQQVSTSSRRWERESILYCTVRNWVLTFLYFLGVSTETLAKFYGRGQR